MICSSIVSYHIYKFIERRSETAQKRSQCVDPRVEEGFEKGDGCWKRPRQQGYSL